MLKIFCLAMAVVLLAGCPIKRPNEVRATEEKKGKQEVVKTFEVPKDMRFLQYAQGCSAKGKDVYVFEEYVPESKRGTRVVFMILEEGVWRRVAHLE